MKEVIVTGTHYECGLQVGKVFAGAIQWRLQHHTITEQEIQKHHAAFDLMVTQVAKAFPGYVEELQGMAEGAGVSLRQLLFLNCAELSQYHHGCSSIACVENSEKHSRVYLAHNEDGDVEEKKTSCALVTYKLPNNSFTSFCYPGELPGCAYSWNKYGLFFTVNYINVEPKKRFFPRYFISRKLLEATSCTEAIAILRQFACDSAFHIFIGQGEEIYSVEQYYEKVSVNKVMGTYYHTNHLIHGLFKSTIYGSTMERFKRLTNLMPFVDPVTVLFDVQGRPKPLYACKGDVSKTLSTVVFEPLRGKVVVYPTRRLSSKVEFKLKK